MAINSSSGALARATDQGVGDVGAVLVGGAARRLAEARRAIGGRDPGRQLMSGVGDGDRSQPWRSPPRRASDRRVIPSSAAIGKKRNVSPGRKSDSGSVVGSTMVSGVRPITGQPPGAGLRRDDCLPSGDRDGAGRHVRPRDRSARDGLREGRTVQHRGPARRAEAAHGQWGRTVQPNHLGSATAEVPATSSRSGPNSPP